MWVMFTLIVGHGIITMKISIEYCTYRERLV